jgi:hypothetical protein
LEVQCADITTIEELIFIKVSNLSTPEEEICMLIKSHDFHILALFGFVDRKNRFLKRKLVSAAPPELKCGTYISSLA